LSSPVTRNVRQLVSTFIVDHLLERRIEVSHPCPSICCRGQTAS
jgi:hypothetical protein